MGALSKTALPGTTQRPFNARLLKNRLKAKAGLGLGRNSNDASSRVDGSCTKVLLGGKENLVLVTGAETVPSHFAGSFQNWCKYSWEKL